MSRIGIIGSEGRMGQALARAIAAAGHENAGGVDRGGDVAGLADHSDALLDFSAPPALESNLHAAIGAGIPILVGTTGLEERHHAAIDAAARAIPVLQTGNTSLGVTLLAHLVRQAAVSRSGLAGSPAARRHPRRGDPPTARRRRGRCAGRSRR